MASQIVVGVNGREPQTQLTWAVDEALRWGEPLLIVHCFDDRYEIELPDPSAEQIDKANVILEHAVRYAQSLGVDAVTRLCDGFPGEALVEASEGTRLLVVGASHKRRLARAIHTSVVTYCVRHAHCPIALVPIA